MNAELPVDSSEGTIRFYEVIRRVSSALIQIQNDSPYFPNDPIHAAAIVTAYSAGLLDSAIEFNYESGSSDAMEFQAIDMAATAIRFLMNHSRYRVHKSITHKSGDFIREVSKDEMTAAEGTGGYLPNDSTKK